MGRLLMFLPPILFAALAGLFLAGMFRDDPDGLPSAIEGREAPALVLTPLGDAPLLDRSVVLGPGVKLVNFWASWCAPCRAEHPMLEQLAAEGIAVHGVNYKDTAANALGFLAELGNPYTAMGADDTGRVGLDWGLYGVPETFVIDPEGRVVLRFAGPISAAALEDTIRPALAKAAGG